MERRTSLRTVAHCRLSMVMMLRDVCACLKVADDTNNDDDCLGKNPLGVQSLVLNLHYYVTLRQRLVLL
jgi:hypothetical protein